MASEYFIESLLPVIGHSSDRLPDPTFNISHIFVEAQTCEGRVIVTDQCFFCLFVFFVCLFFIIILPARTILLIIIQCVNHT